MTKLTVAARLNQQAIRARPKIPAQDNSPIPSAELLERLRQSLVLLAQTLEALTPKE